MNVAQNVAQSIVEEMKKIIDQDINYFDTNSVIIASTDKSRIGDYHGGAKRVLEQNSDLIIRYDEQYEGAKKGINVPVYFEKSIIGVIGITGEKEEVEKYGKIIKRMTEILIREAYLKEQENIDKESKRQFIEEILFRSNSDEKALGIRGNLLNIQTNIPRIVIVSKFLDNEDKEALLEPTLNEKIFNYYRNQVSYDAQNLIVQSGTNIIMILRILSENKLNRIVSNIINDVNNEKKVSVYFGIGGVSNNSQEIKKSYMEAKKALDVAVIFQNKGIQYYKDLDIGLLVDEIPKDTIKEYIEKIFGDLTKDQIDGFNEMIEVFVKHNGSITKTSEELFVHKNTLQYRLNKIKQLTGYDPRIINEMVILYLAFTLNKLK